MPSTTPDFSTVTGGGSSVRGTDGGRSAPDAPSGSVNVVGALGLRRCGGNSPGLDRSVFGQASSKEGGSPGSSGGGAAGGLGRRSGDSRSGGIGSLVRVCVRSRSLRDDDENSRLRLGLAGAAASAGVAAGGVSARGRAASYHGGGDVDGAAGSALPVMSADGWSRVNGKPLSPGDGSRATSDGSTGRTAASPDSSAAPGPSRWAMIFSSLTAVQRASMIAPVQTPVTPARISVLPTLNSLFGIPTPIASRPAKTRPIPAINIATIIEPTPNSRA